MTYVSAAISSRWSFKKNKAFPLLITGERFIKNAVFTPKFEYFSLCLLKVVHPVQLLRIMPWMIFSTSGIIGSNIKLNNHTQYYLEAS